LRIVLILKRMPSSKLAKRITSAVRENLNDEGVLGNMV